MTINKDIIKNKGRKIINAKIEKKISNNLFNIRFINFAIPKKDYI